LAKDFSFCVGRGGGQGSRGGDRGGKVTGGRKKKLIEEKAPM